MDGLAGVPHPRPRPPCRKKLQWDLARSADQVLPAGGAAGEATLGSTGCMFVENEGSPLSGEGGKVPRCSAAQGLRSSWRRT